MRGAWLAALAGACTTTMPPPRDGSREEPPLQAIEIESAPPGPPPSSGGRAALGFVLESTLRARRMRGGGPTMSFELSNGATVIDGDRLQLSVRTSQDAYLYVAFCSQQARDPRYLGLTVFPEQGAIRARAHEATIVPDRAAEIVLDDKPGPEVLYLILSRVELSSSDAGLAQVLAAARQGSQSADCGAPFRTAVAGSRKGSKPSAVWSGKLQARAKHRSPPGAASGTPQRAIASVEEDPIVEIQRGGHIVWNNGMSMGLEADPDGIVILRYGLTHVAAPSP
jgi:hypothetical protein